MNKTYSYYDPSLFIIYTLIYIVLIGAISCVAIIKDLSILFILLFPILLLAFIRIHRTFFAKIIFTEEYLTYKSLFKTITIDYKTCSDILVLTRLHYRRKYPWMINENMYGYDFECFNDVRQKTEFPIGKTFALIGSIDSYSSNPFFTLMTPVKESYITIEHRMGISDVLHYISRKRDEFSEN